MYDPRFMGITVNMYGLRPHSTAHHLEAGTVSAAVKEEEEEEVDLRLGEWEE